MLIVVMQIYVKDIIETKTNKKLHLPGKGGKRKTGQTYLLTYILQVLIEHSHQIHSFIDTKHQTIALVVLECLPLHLGYFAVYHLVLCLTYHIMESRIGHTLMQ